MNRLIKWLRAKPVPSKDFLYVRDIIRKFLEDEKVEKIVGLSPEKYFLVNKEDNVNIAVSYDQVVIAQNHSFCITLPFELRLMEQLIKEIRTAIEEDRKKLEARLFYNQIDILKKIVTL